MASRILAGPASTRSPAAQCRPSTDEKAPSGERAQTGGAGWRPGGSGCPASRRTRGAPSREGNGRVSDRSPSRHSRVGSCLCQECRIRIEVVGDFPSAVSEPSRFTGSGRSSPSGPAIGSGKPGHAVGAHASRQGGRRARRAVRTGRRARIGGRARRGARTAARSKRHHAAHGGERNRYCCRLDRIRAGLGDVAAPVSEEAGARGQGAPPRGRNERQNAGSSPLRQWCRFAGETVGASRGYGSSPEVVGMTILRAVAVLGLSRDVPLRPGMGTTRWRRPICAG